MLNKASDVLPGRSDIDAEIHSPENSRFVLHDSQGFEPGEVENYDTVKSFIARRGKEEHVKDKLHAIWYRTRTVIFLQGSDSVTSRYCIQIPRTGGRVLETGDENFLRQKFKGLFGGGGDSVRIPCISMLKTIHPGSSCHYRVHPVRSPVQPNKV